MSGDTEKMGGNPTEPDHRQIEELLGAYALDAVDGDTAAMIERHVEHCVRCSVEVAHHHEVAGLLANSGGESPPELWDAIARRLSGSATPSWERLAARLESDRPPAGAAPPRPDEPSRLHGPRRSTRGTRRWVTAGAVVVAAAAVIAAVLLGVRVDHLDQQVRALGPPSGLRAAERAALAVPTTRSIQLAAPPGSPTTARATVVLTASGTGFLQADRLSSLPVDRTYQLWGVVGGETISLGLLGPDPTIVPFSVAGNRPVRAFAITDERSGGVVQSANRPVVAGQTGVTS